MTKKKISIMDFENNPNIGIYMFVNDKFCLLGGNIKEEKKNEIEKNFNVPIYNITILETNLVGIFVAGNNDFLIIPDITEKEKKVLNDICRKHNVKLIQISNFENTYGNNICLSENEILLSNNYNDNFCKKIKNFTNLKVIKIKSEKYKAIGSTIICINDMFFLSQEYNENDVKEISNKVCGVGTVNKGSNYISSGIVGNKNGIIIGNVSSTIEIQNIIESLNFI